MRIGQRRVKLETTFIALDGFGETPLVLPSDGLIKEQRC